MAISRTIACDRCGKSEPTVTETNGSDIGAMYARIGSHRSSQVRTITADLCTECFTGIVADIAAIMSTKAPAVTEWRKEPYAPHAADVETFKRVHAVPGHTVVVPDFKLCEGCRLGCDVESGCMATKGKRVHPCGCHLDDHAPGQCNNCSTCHSCLDGDLCLREGRCVRT